jgi:HSP20 family molecular chaperone IbpA
MRGSLDFDVPSLGVFGSPLFGEKILDALMTGECPEGTRTYQKDIIDADGNKVGKTIVRTYSSGRSTAPSSLVGSNYPPCNIYTDENKRKVYEFAIAGYDPKNVSFAVDENNPSYINLILKSGLTEVKESEKEEEDDEDKKEEPKVEKAIIYDYQKFVVKDHTCPFYVDRDRYDIEQSTVEFKNGTVKISFEPKKVAFNPKVIN